MATIEELKHKVLISGEAGSKTDDGHKLASKVEYTQD